MEKPVVSVVNQKGGVGKTTTCVNLAAGLAALGYRVLLVDIDPQGNATTACGLKQRDLKYSVSDWLNDSDVFLSSIYSNAPEGFDVVGATQHLAALPGNVPGDVHYGLFAQKIARVIHEYDCVLIDCPPSFGFLTWSALLASSGLLVPMQCEYYPLEGLSTIIATVKKINQSANPNLKIVGIVRTMFDRRNRLSNEVSEQLIGHFGALVFKAVVPRNVRLAEAPSHGQSAIAYDLKSSGAMAYMAVALEFIRAVNLQKIKNLSAL